MSGIKTIKRKGFKGGGMDASTQSFDASSNPERSGGSIGRDDSAQDGMQGLSYNSLNKIGLNNTTLEFDKSDTFIGGSSIYANARDYAKFGYLYLRDGLWDGEQIISKDWIDQTRKPSKHTDNQYSNKFWHINNNKYNFVIYQFKQQSI